MTFRSLSALALFALGCSDYDLHAPVDAEPGEDPGVPSLFVDPYRVDVGVVCESATSVVHVANHGTAPLDVTGLTFEGAWSGEIPALPVRLGPNEEIGVPVSGLGTGALLVTSTDPNHLEVEVPLLADPNEPPVVTLVTPSSGEVVGIDSTTTFLASVEDDLDPPEQITVVWSSDVDGPLQTAPAEPDETSSYLWNGAFQSPGHHAITLEATDSCGAVATDATEMCQQEGYLADNLTLETWHFEGTAQWDTANSWVQLTTPDYYQGGTAFQTSATVSGENVSIEFQFFIGGGTGADGISLTALDSVRMTDFVGEKGGGLGSAGLPGWSVEVDTFYNEGADPTEEDHLSFSFDGGATVAWAALPEMEDTGWHTLEIDVTAPHVRVAIDGVVWLEQDIAGYYAFPAYVGFTAATGDSTNYHLIDALQVTNLACEE